MRRSVVVPAAWPRRSFWPQVLAFVLLSGFASAQTTDPETRVTEGIQLRMQGRDSEALEQFRRAAEDAPNSPRVLGHLALALHANQQWLESERIMLEVVRAKDDPWVLRHQAELEKSLESVQDHLAWLEVDTPVLGSLSINGELVGTAPSNGPMRVVATACTVKITAPNRVPIAKTVNIGARQYLKVYLLEPTAPSAPQASEEPRTRAPADTRVQSQPIPRARRKDVGLMLLGAGAAGLAASIALGIDALVLRDRSRSKCSEAECSIDSIKTDARGRQSATAATISFVTGATALGVSAVLLW
ncbi:MAG TPA: hypothetical protein VKP30_08590 [Polyangiaceae bacterium]|nr:hypothetical protein [Polyangiaceae bacterium]